MPHKKLPAQIAEWNKARENEKIRDAVLALPESERTDELVCLLARALNNEDDYSGALAALDGILETCADDPLYCFRRGFALYTLHREPEALPWFKKAPDAGLEDVSEEMPNDYYPKSMSEWAERAERRAARREEMGVFETERRAARKKEPREADFTDADLEGLWDDCDYSMKSCVGRAPTDEEIAAAEAELGYRLPASYKALMKRHNGGVLARNSFEAASENPRHAAGRSFFRRSLLAEPADTNKYQLNLPPSPAKKILAGQHNGVFGGCLENPMRRDWTVGTFSVKSIFGLDREKPCSLFGEFGSRFWIEEWGYPDIGVAICDTMSGGHDMIFLDYSDCGPDGEPCVVHIDQEGDYEITYLADDFASFVRGLAPFADEDEDE